MSHPVPVAEPPAPGLAAVAARPSPLRRLVVAASRPAARKGMLSIVDQAVVSGTSFATSVLIGRHCSQEVLGVYVLALSVLRLAGGVQSELVSAPYLVYCHRRQGAALASYTGSALVHQAIIALLAVLALGCPVALLSLGWGPAGLSSAVWVMCGVTPLILLREHLRQLTFAHLQIGSALVLDGAVAALQIGALLLLAGSDRLSVESATLVMGAACGVAGLGWFLARRIPFRIDRRQVWHDWRRNWQFGRWTLASHLLSCAMVYVVPWMLALAHSESATGRFAACLTIVNLLGMFVTGISNVLTPRAARAFAAQGAPALRRVLAETLVVYLVSVGSFCLFLLLTGDLSVTLVYGDEYADCGGILIVLALQLLINTVGITVGNGLWALDRPRANFLADATTLAVALVPIIPLIAAFGALGAAVALLCGTAAGTVVRCLTFLSLMRSVEQDRQGCAP